MGMEIQGLGKKYNEYHRQIMFDRKEGLTKTYNRFHDPEETSEDVACVRTLHVEIDKSVASAYGWDDLELDHGFYEKPRGLRYTINDEARRQVLTRLLELREYY